MKLKTLSIFQKFMKDDKIIFKDESPEVDFYLNNKEINSLIKSHIGYSVKRESTIKKHLTNIANGVLQISIEVAKENDLLNT